jgi:hypothetical protein
LEIVTQLYYFQIVLEDKNDVFLKYIYNFFPDKKKDYYKQNTNQTKDKMYCQIQEGYHKGTVYGKGTRYEI